MVGDLSGLAAWNPSHDTIGRVFGAIDPTEFQVGFRSRTEAICGKIEGVLMTDGKTVDFISSLTSGRLLLLHSIRTHWQIENSPIRYIIRPIVKMRAVFARANLLNISLSCGG